MAFQWEGKVVYITGASSGLGEALARAMGRSGAHIGLMARRREQLESIKSDIEAEGATVAIACCDVQDRDQVERAVAELTELLGQPDILIANAGLNRVIKSHDIDMDKVDLVLRTNLLGAIYSIGAVLPGMVQRGHGHIVGMSSVAGFRGMPSMGVYSASKAGLTTFLESLRIDLAPRGIAVTSIHPGFVRTPFTESNRWPMPFMVELDRATVIMLRGIERQRRRVDFPWPMVVGLHLARLLPAWLWDWFGGQAMRSVRIEKKVQPEPDKQIGSSSQDS